MPLADWTGELGVEAPQGTDAQFGTVVHGLSLEDSAGLTANHEAPPSSLPSTAPLIPATLRESLVFNWTSSVHSPVSSTSFKASCKS